MDSIKNNSRGKMLSVLHNKNFTSYWIATFAYYAGIHMEITAYGWLVYSITGSVFLLGLATTISTLGDFVNIPGGFIADRGKKKSILNIVQATLGINALLTAVLLSTGSVEYQYIVILSLIHTMARQFAMPSRLSIISEIVSNEEFMNAYSLYYVANNSMTVLGPIIAGILASTLGTAAIYGVIGISHLFYLVPFRATHIISHVKAHHQASIRQEFGELLSFARHNTTILTLLGLGCGLILFSASATVLNPVFASDILGVGPIGLGLLGSATGVGSLVGSLISASLSHSKRKTLLLLGSGVLRGVALVLFAGSTLFIFSLIYMALAGIANSIHTVARSALFQLCSPSEMRGRVTGLYEVTHELRPVGTLLIGILAQNAGAPFAVGVFGLIWAGFCIAVAVLRPSFRRLKLD